MLNAQIMPPNDFLDLNLPTGADEDTPGSFPELSHSDSESTNESLGDDDDIDPYGVLTEYERDNNVRLRAKVFLWFQVRHYLDVRRQLTIWHSGWGKACGTILGPGGRRRANYTLRHGVQSQRASFQGSTLGWRCIVAVSP